MSAPSAINNAKQIIIGGTPSSGAITTAGLKDAAFQVATNAGEVACFTPEGVRLDEAGAATADRFVVAVSRGAAKPPLVSDVIEKSSITSCKLKVYGPATEQVTAIGYNGTSGLIADVATYAGELYKVTILVHQFMSGTDSEKLKAGYYQSQLTDGQAEIALGIVNSIIKNFSREVSNSDGDKPVIAKAICNVAASATNDLTNNATVTRGSATFSVATALTYNGTSGTLAVGDYIRFSAALNGTLALTDSVYKVVSISGLNVTVDRPITEPSGTWTDAGDGTQVIPAADGAAANWGVVLTGTSIPFNVRKKRYAKVRFDATLNEAFGSTQVVNNANAYEGAGTYESVAQLEAFTAGFMAESYEMGEPFLFDADADLLADSAVTGGGYDIISINFSDSRVVSFQNEVSPKELLIAIPATAPAYAVTGSADDVSDVLEVLAFGSANGNLAMS